MTPTPPRTARQHEADTHPQHGYAEVTGQPAATPPNRRRRCRGWRGVASQCAGEAHRASMSQPRRRHPMRQPRVNPEARPHDDAGIRVVPDGAEVRRRSRLRHDHHTSTCAGTASPDHRPAGSPATATRSASSAGCVAARTTAASPACAGGLARHLDIDPIIVRVALVVLVFFGGSGLLLYGAMWLLVPEEGHAVPAARARRPQPQHRPHRPRVPRPSPPSVTSPARSGSRGRW